MNHATLNLAPARANRTLVLLSALVCLPFALTACEKEVSKSESSSTKTTQTPEGTKKTTETTEKKVEVERKDPR